MNRMGFTLIELLIVVVIFFFNDTATTEIYTLSLHDALPISMKSDLRNLVTAEEAYFADSVKYTAAYRSEEHTSELQSQSTIASRLLLDNNWYANIANVNTTKTCSIYIGSTSTAPANKEGEPK